MTTRIYPLTADDLRDLADELDEVTKSLSDSLGGVDDWRWGVTVEIKDDSGHVLGQVRPHADGWFGFYPKGIEA